MKEMHEEEIVEKQYINKSAWNYEEKQNAEN